LIPPLTVADQVDAETLNTVEESLRDHLPIQCVAREIWLMVSDAAGFWTKKASFSLSLASGKDENT